MCKAGLAIMHLRADLLRTGSLTQIYTRMNLFILCFNDE
ncbi:unnamed protein product [Callosobruchus maculatus]|uniref:Uncharacterized protein n=1 Tax=Callosobruchus maculatus TaxID=64391 RepID=A0A653D3I2_CALMS|nr:unnamed protein product [Callosobruchus maculatus]